MRTNHITALVLLVLVGVSCGRIATTDGGADVIPGWFCQCTESGETVSFGGLCAKNLDDAQARFSATHRERGGVAAECGCTPDTEGPSVRCDRITWVEVSAEQRKLKRAVAKLVAHTKATCDEFAEGLKVARVKLLVDEDGVTDVEVKCESAKLADCVRHSVSEWDLTTAITGRETVEVAIILGSSDEESATTPR